METKQRIEIPLSKTKIIIGIILSLVFIVVGVIMIINPPNADNTDVENPYLVFIVGIIAAVLGGITGIMIFRKLFDKTPGLIISDEGIFDNASIISSGFIPWTDIEDIREIKIQNQVMLNIVVKNPQKYIDKHKNNVKRKLMQLNYNRSGMVVGFSAVGLKCSFKELKEMLNQKFEEYKNKSKE